MKITTQKDKEYGIPEEKKFPLDTRAHVISAVKFFNYAKPRFRKELAKNLIKKIKEYDIRLTPTKTNDFYNYYQPDDTMIHCAMVGNKFLEEYLSSDDILSHHGIVGQKWGHRNGPPYPLGAESHSKAQIAAAKKAGVKVGKSTGRYVKARSSKVAGQAVSASKPGGGQNAYINSLIKSGKAKIDDLKDYQVGSLTKFTRSDRPGEEWVSGLINGHDFDWQEMSSMVVNGTDHVDENVAKTIARNNANFRTSDNFQDIDENGNVVRDHSFGQLLNRDLDLCNPGFGDAGTTQNCAKCSADLEMRLRGYEVNAGRQSYPSSADAMGYWFKGAQRIDMDSDAAEDGLRSYGPMTSGTISIRYPDNGGGHSMHWTNDKDGNFEIQDGQNGRCFESVKEMMDEYGADKSASVSTYRLDNCEPNLDAMEQDSVLRLANDSGFVENKWSGKKVDTW